MCVCVRVFELVFFYLCVLVSVPVCVLALACVPWSSSGGGTRLIAWRLPLRRSPQVCTAMTMCSHCRRTRMPSFLAAMLPPTFHHLVCRRFQLHAVYSQALPARCSNDHMQLLQRRARKAHPPQHCTAPGGLHDAPQARAAATTQLDAGLAGPAACGHWE